ncbi:DUF962-domain-containing protein [Bimuria novae-zelandiae CBS 107.79]|uniref:DUF962-domain-containing protein n=1 Tax=Bimuria novae-zelandiae CBS 107.79 TaxID=1447943 RepID=A0A6A5UVH0_9PLEO|nr:DUF962-domain-containing protein [Bimuria novae-zelandiae CBS 107.79]
MSLNLEKQLRFYGAYHHNPVNIGIHTVCVPAILFATVVLFTNSPEVPLPSWLTIPHLPLNLASFFLVLYSTIYILMEPVAGAMLAPILVAATAYANHLTSTYGSEANKWAGGVFLVSWIAQFVGHGKFEGRAPALLDNIAQAFLLAPFFVFFELLFAVGYRPELKKRVEKAVEEEIQKYRQKKGQAANGHANGNGKSS